MNTEVKKSCRSSRHMKSNSWETVESQDQQDNLEYLASVIIDGGGGITESAPEKTC